MNSLETFTNQLIQHGTDLGAKLLSALVVLVIGLWLCRWVIRLVQHSRALDKLDPSLLRLADISETYGCPLARVMRKELRARGIQHLKVVFSPEEAAKPASLETPPPGRRSVPGSTPWVPATAGLLLGSAIVRDLIAETKRD